MLAAIARRRDAARAPLLGRGAPCSPSLEPAPAPRAPSRARRMSSSNLSIRIELSAHPLTKPSLALDFDCTHGRPVERESSCDAQHHPRPARPFDGDPFEQIAARQWRGNPTDRFGGVEGAAQQSGLHVGCGPNLGSAESWSECGAGVGRVWGGCGARAANAPGWRSTAPTAPAGVGSRR